MSSVSIPTNLTVHLKNCSSCNQKFTEINTQSLPFFFQLIELAAQNKKNQNFFEENEITVSDLSKLVAICQEESTMLSDATAAIDPAGCITPVQYENCLEIISCLGNNVLTRQSSAADGNAKGS